MQVNACRARVDATTHPRQRRSAQAPRNVRGPRPGIDIAVTWRGTITEACALWLVFPHKAPALSEARSGLFATPLVARLCSGCAQRLCADPLKAFRSTLLLVLREASPAAQAVPRATGRSESIREDLGRRAFKMAPAVHTTDPHRTPLGEHAERRAGRGEQGEGRGDRRRELRTARGSS